MMWYVVGLDVMLTEAYCARTSLATKTAIYGDMAHGSPRWSRRGWCVDIFLATSHYQHCQPGSGRSRRWHSETAQTMASMLVSRTRQNHGRTAELRVFALGRASWWCGRPTRDQQSKHSWVSAPVGVISIPCRGQDSVVRSLLSSVSSSNGKSCSIAQ